MAALSLAFGSAGGAQSASSPPPSKRMPDGKEWTTANLNVTTEPSYCYDNSAENCRKYGRLYTWESALQACRALAGTWRMPTNEEWRQLANHYGGLRQESPDLGKAAYMALITGGNSGFNAVYGGGRTGTSGEYQRLDAHGLYWSSTASSPDHAWVYNFGRNGQSVNRHKDFEKLWAVSVRCVTD
jgi:uncharacterized protein (TIGR02145 family)